jgi:uncharacterized protein (DUF983 family)
MIDEFAMPVIASTASTMWTAIRRAVLGKCQKCGKDALYKAYLKQVDHCAVCGEPYRHIRADDAPLWLTILVVGHIIVPLIFVIDGWVLWPVWVAMLVWPAATAVLALAVLPRAKGVFLAIIWATRSPGSERG